ncbi:MAG: XRE family transcriptional regulator [Burkholderiales bacterium]
MATRAAKDVIRKQLAQAISARLEQIRTANDEELKQQQIADEAGLTQSKVSQLIREDTTHFSLERLMDIAERLELTVRATVTRPYGKG